MAKKQVIFPQSKKNRKGAKPSVRKVQKKMQSLAVSAPKTPFADVGKILGSTIGNIFNNGQLGGNLGNIAGGLVGKIFGSGAYSMNQNNLLDAFNSQVPVMHSNSESITLRHREYIADISSATTFTTAQYDINPGLTTTFPYLSTIASCFQEYKFNGLVFEFKTTSSDALNSTNTALGTVILAAQYRADAVPFVNKQQMLNEMWSADSKPSCSFFLPIECDPAENPLKVQYVRTGPVPSGQDAKLYDLAQVTAAAVGSQAAAVVGELWATYDVTLMKPQLTANVGISSKSAIWEGLNPANSTPLGTEWLTYDNLGLSLTGTVVTYPVGVAGYYQFQYVNIGSSTATGGPTLTFANCTDESVIGNVAPGFGFGFTTTTVAIAGVILISDPTKAATITFSTGGTYPNGKSYFYTSLMPISFIPS